MALFFNVKLCSYAAGKLSFWIFHDGQQQQIGFLLKSQNGSNNFFFETLCCFEMGKDTKPKSRPYEL